MKILLLFTACLFSLALTAQPKPAQEILTKAYAKAKKENKNVILIFHASWCVWCKKMDASMQDEKCKKYFDDNYVTIHLTVEETNEKKDLENPGGDAVRLKYHGEQAGLPFWVILNKNGQLLGDSFMRKEGVSKNEAGVNIGCPASEPEVAAFINLLRSSSTLSDQALEVIATRFKKNKV